MRWKVRPLKSSEEQIEQEMLLLCDRSTGTILTLLTPRTRYIGGRIAAAKANEIKYAINIKSIYISAIYLTCVFFIYIDSYRPIFM